VASDVSAEPGPAILARGLVKHFGRFQALRGLTMTVPRGAFYAFLGPNGAGKSTTISIVTGLYPPDSGEVALLGIDARRDPINAKLHLGVVPEELALFDRLTGRQQLTFCGRMYGLDGPTAAARAEELLALVDLAAKADALVAGYSKGMRRRLAIAAALVHAPEVLLLDEPFEGIDVLAAGVIRELLRELSRIGVTILLTTHVLEIADRLATHAGVVLGGAIVAEGDVASLKAAHDRDSLEAVFEHLVQVPTSRAARLSFYGARE
jgi:ABC-2 type transport system ATP-binding protein